MFYTYQYLKFHAQLSWACFFYNLGARLQSERTYLIQAIFISYFMHIIYTKYI